MEIFHSYVNVYQRVTTMIHLFGGARAVNGQQWAQGGWPIASEWQDGAHRCRNRVQLVREHDSNFTMVFVGDISN